MILKKKIKINELRLRNKIDDKNQNIILNKNNHYL